MLVSTSAKPSLSPMAELQDNSSDSDSAQSDGDEGGSEGGLGDEDEGEADRSVASTSRVILANGRATKVKLTGGRAKKYGCTFEGCNKSYSRPVRLEEHLRSHTGERPFICDVCKATFLRASHLRAHARSHMDEAEKPSECDECGKRFWTNQHLRKHVDTMHKGKTYDCHLCTEKFRKHNHLRVHLAEAHAPPGTNPFPCTHPGCDKTFKQNHQLKTHQKTHDASRYQCAHPACLHLPLDQRAFGNWTALQRHTNQAHPPACPRAECNGQTFTSRRGLKLHMEGHDRKDGVVAGEKGGETDGGYTTDGRGKKRRRGRGAGRRRKGRQSGAGGGVETEVAVDDKSGGEDGPRRKKAKVDEDDGLPWKCSVQDGCTKAFQSRDALLSHIERKHAKKLAAAHQSPAGLAGLAPLPALPRPPTPPPPPPPTRPAFAHALGTATAPLTPTFGLSASSLDFPTLAPAGPSPFASLVGLPAVPVPTGFSSSPVPSSHAAPAARWGTSSLLDLLTGHDYAPALFPTLADVPDAAFGLQAGAPGSSPLKGTGKSKAGAGRKYRCPFPGVLAIAEPVGAGEWEGGGGESEEVEELGRECQWRFKRAYDVERHLRSKHGCRADPDKLEDWLEEERREEEAGGCGAVGEVGL